MRYYKIIGLSLCFLLIVACFLPWAYYADLDKNFTGFYSEQNNYGKPGKFFTGFAIIAAILILTNKVWAKRTLLFLAAINIGYLIKTYLLFTTCYNTYCPEKKIGLYLLIISSVGILITVLFPKIELPPEKTE